jgi:hypothetical protein
MKLKMGLPGLLGQRPVTGAVAPSIGVCSGCVQKPVKGHC